MSGSITMLDNISMCHRCEGSHDAAFEKGEKHLGGCMGNDLPPRYKRIN